MAFLAIFSAAPVFADSTGQFPLLRESHDPGLQRKLENVIDRTGMREAVTSKRLALALVDISDLEDPRLASVNGDHMMYAASLPKIAILLGAFVEIERGNMVLDPQTRETLTQMIRVSSNEAATTMLNRVGKQNLLEILQSERFRLYDPAVNGGLWVGKEYGKSGAYSRDPLHNLSHGATAIQAARFYYLLETRQLVDDDLSREMKAMLGQPKINHKFVRGLSDVKGVKIFRKSGSWSRWHADSAIVQSAGKKYIVVALSADTQGGQWLADLIRPLHDLIVPATVATATN